MRGRREITGKSMRPSHHSHACESFALATIRFDLSVMPTTSDNSPWHVLADVADRSQRYLDGVARPRCRADARCA